MGEIDFTKPNFDDLYAVARAFVDATDAFDLYPDSYGALASYETATDDLLDVARALNAQRDART